MTCFRINQLLTQSRNLLLIEWNDSKYLQAAGRLKPTALWGPTYFTGSGFVVYQLSVDSMNVNMNSVHTTIYVT
jgi:hypothetical protein